MVDTLVQWITTKLAGFPKELIIFIISMLPILELRGGIIASALLNVDIVRATVVCFIGNLLPIPFILLLITPVFSWMKKTRFFRPIVEKLEAKSMSKSEKIQKYEFIGLMLFVGIPLPGTGAWTGALIAALLGIKFKKALLAILCGLFLALIIMNTVSYFIPWIIRSFA